MLPRRQQVEGRLRLRAQASLCDAQRETPRRGKPLEPVAPPPRPPPPPAGAAEGCRRSASRVFAPFVVQPAEMATLFNAAESVTKWAAGINDKVSIWTVVWAMHDKLEHALSDPSEADGECSVPLIWVRHDRSATLPPGCIRVCVNGTETCVNHGVHAELAEGMEEVIEFEAFGEPAILVVTVESTHWLQMQVQPNFTYSLQLGGRMLTPDKPERVSAAQREARASRCRVREWRLVSQRADEWTGEMVVEYAVCFDQRLIRWCRYSDFVELHRQIYACFPSDAAGGLPNLPPKTWLPSSAMSGDRFHNSRRDGLQAFLRAVFGMPRGPRLPALRKFLGISDHMTQDAHQRALADQRLKRGVLCRVLSPRGIMRPCSVVERADTAVLVHYEGYAPIYDEWLKVGSTRVKTQETAPAGQALPDGAAPTTGNDAAEQAAAKLFGAAGSTAGSGAAGAARRADPYAQYRSGVGAGAGGGGDPVAALLQPSAADADAGGGGGGVAASTPQSEDASSAAAAATPASAPAPPPKGGDDGAPQWSGNAAMLSEQRDGTVHSSQGKTVVKAADFKSPFDDDDDDGETAPPGPGVPAAGADAEGMENVWL
eukprot:SAG22_NODE_1026_length_5964_cov_7.098039_4_plen_600_part_00